MTGLHDRPPALCVLIEPAPYILRLTEELARAWSAPVRTAFVAGALTQAWGEMRETENARILPQGTRPAIAALWREMRTHRPGVVFVAGWSQPVIIAAIIMGSILGAKIVSMSDTQASHSSGPRVWFKKAIMRLIDRFSPGGIRQERYLIAQGIAPERIFPGRMTSDIQAIRDLHASHAARSREEIRLQLDIADYAPVFLFVGRLEPVKGPDILLQAFTRAQLPPSARLLVVGDGSMLDEVTAVAATDPRICVLGRLQGQSLWAHFFAADVLVVPSRNEPWGLVVNEALAAGAALIVADSVGCIDDLVNPEVNGLVVPTEDVASLAHALALLAEDGPLRAKLRDNAPASIEQWTSQAWANNVIEAWTDSLSIQSPPTKAGTTKKMTPT